MGMGMGRKRFAIRKTNLSMRAHAVSWRKAVRARERRQTAKENYGDVMCLISATGGNGRKYRLEATQRLRAVNAEQKFRASGH